MATYTLEFDSKFGDYDLYSHDVYPVGSVLEGQDRRSLVQTYRTPQEAQAAHPDKKFDVLYHSTKVEHTMPDLPPSWFDPLAAGEEW